MKKFRPTACLIFIVLLFSGCSRELTDNNEDTSLILQIQGKWKLTASYSGNQTVTTPITNGYEIEFKADKTFISNEENGYTGGKYTVFKSPSNNLRLIYKKNWAAKQVYKYINAVDNQNIYLQASNPNLTPEGQTFSTGYILTRIP